MGPPVCMSVSTAACYVYFQVALLHLAGEVTNPHRSDPLSHQSRCRQQSSPTPFFTADPKLVRWWWSSRQHLEQLCSNHHQMQCSGPHSLRPSLTSRVGVCGFDALQFAVPKVVCVCLALSHKSIMFEKVWGLEVGKLLVW